MGDAMSDYYKSERKWNRAELLLDCYYGRKNMYTREEAKIRIKEEFKGFSSPESLKSYMYNS